MRQKALKIRQQEELRGLCEIFYTMEASIVEAVYESCDKQRGIALQQLMDMVGNTPELSKSLRAEAFRLHKVMMEKKSIVESSIRCPISGAVMKDPVLASDGYTYDRPSIMQWLKSKTTSPATGEEMDANKLVPNHQLKSQIQSWVEYKESEDSDQGVAEIESVIPAVSSRPTSAAASGMVVEARNVMPGKARLAHVDETARGEGVVGAEVLDTEAGAPEAGGKQEAGAGGFVTSMVRALSDLGGPAGAARSPPK